MRLLIVDDEPLARAKLALLCEQKHDVAVVGEADSGVAAINAAERLRPDVILLDTVLPDMTGFDVLRAARRTAAPLGIMIAANAADELHGPEAGVIDYLVKPVGGERFAASLERARQRCRTESCIEREYAHSEPSPLAAAYEVPDGLPTLLVGEREHRMYVLRPERIEFIESLGNYVKLHVGNAEYISRDSVKRLAGILVANGFVRIERSILINVNAILYAQRVGRGTYAFTLLSGSRVQSGSTYREEILRVLRLEQVASSRS
jgi:two-component system, LytTR family, response regulator